MQVILHIPTGEFVDSWFFGNERNENSIHVRIRKTAPRDLEHFREHLDHVMFSRDKIYIHQMYATGDPKMPELERIFEASIEEFEYCIKD